MNVVRSLVMTSLNYCMVCHKLYSARCNEININRLLGCIYCDKCYESGCVKKGISRWIENEGSIPCRWLFAEGAVSRKFTFYRKSRGTLHEGVCNVYDEDLLIRSHNVVDAASVIDENQYYMKLSFKDNDDGPMYGREVTLANIMAHNKDFYNDLKSCKNLLNNQSIVITYDDLPTKIKDQIEHSYKLSLSTPLDKFLY